MFYMLWKLYQTLSPKVVLLNCVNFKIKSSTILLQRITAQNEEDLKLMNGSTSLKLLEKNEEDEKLARLKMLGLCYWLFIIKRCIR